MYCIQPCLSPRCRSALKFRRCALPLRSYRSEKEKGKGGGGPEWPFFCPAAYIRPSGRMSEVTWSFFFPTFPHKHTHILSHARSRSSSFSSLLFSKCLERPRQDTVAVSSCSRKSPPYLKKKKKNLRHHACAPCLATSAKAFTFRLTHPLFSFLLYCGVCRGISTPYRPGGQSPTECISLQVKTFFVCLVLLATVSLPRRK